MIQIPGAVSVPPHPLFERFEPCSAIRSSLLSRRTACSDLALSASDSRSPARKRAVPPQKSLRTNPPCPFGFSFLAGARLAIPGPPGALDTPHTAATMRTFLRGLLTTLA